MHRTCLAVLLAALVLGTAACGDQGEITTTARRGNGTIMPSTGALKVMADWTGDEQAGFMEVLDLFTKATGIKYVYEADRDIVVNLPTRVAGGSPPDVAMIPRPGVMAQLVRDSVLTPITDLVDETTVTANYSQSIIELGSVDGILYGLMAKANSKSTFWYKPASLSDLGFTPPQNWDELTDLVDGYVAAGKTPLSIGGADGWTLTDWFENIYVRIAGPEMYRKLFVTHEVEWTDATVVEAMEHFRTIITPTDEKLVGGAYGTLSDGFIDAFDKMLLGQSELYFEGGFMSSFAEENFPDLTGGEDYSFFLFPEIKPDWEKPVVGGGSLLIVFNPTREAKAFVEFMASPEAGEVWATAARGPVISPNTSVPLTVYTNRLKRLEAEQIVSAGIFVFDGSDLTPGAVGGDALFTGFQDFVTKPDDIDRALEFIEAAADAAY